MIVPGPGWLARVAMRPCLVALALSLISLLGCDRSPESGPLAAPDPARAAPSEPRAHGEIIIPADSPRAKQISVAAVAARPVAVDEVVAPGRVAVEPHRAARVLLPAPGRVAAVHVKLGDVVARGQVVVDLESSEADSALGAERQGAAAERQAQAALAKALTDLGRIRELYQAGAVAQKELIAAQNDQAQAEAALDAATAGRVQARRRIDLLGIVPDGARPIVPVRAPISGRVIDITVAPGENRSDTATPLMTLADLSQVWVTSQVPEVSIRHIRVGDPVAITLVAYPDETFTGRVARIADVLEPETRTLKVHVELPNPDGRFRPDMFATIRHSGKNRTLPVVPADAVVQQYGRSFVFRERQPGQFERREVTVGPRANGSVAVLQGIGPGDRVVVSGAVLLAAE